MSGSIKNKGMGRPKGSKNKITTAANELAEELGVNPLEILLHFAADDWEALGYKSATTTRMFDGGPIEVDRITPETRLAAAKEATKYIYPTQKSVEFTGEQAAFKIIVEDYTKGGT